MFDTIIKAGTVVDGRGAPPRTADIGIRGGLIVEVGKISASAPKVIDADGAIVAPGWVDAHTHYDGQVTWDDQLEGSAANGVTTVVMGNCGVGFAPVPRDGVQALIDLMEGVEDIPGTALYEGMPWGAWETFPEYLDYLSTRRWTVDVGAQLAHGALRFFVMGERAVTRERANADDLARMSKIAQEAVHAGAVGFSTSRIIGHRSMSGHSVPGTFAHETELEAIAQGMRAGGGAVLQAIPASAIGQINGLEPEHSSLLDEVRLFGRLSRGYSLPVVFSTFQTREAPDLWREVLAAVDRENRSGARLAPMVAPRAVSSLTTLGGYHAFMRRPTYRALAGLPHAELVRNLRNPEVKAKILAERDERNPQPGSMENALPPSYRRGLSRAFPLTDPLDYEPSLDRSFGAMADRQGRDRLEYLYDFLLESEGRAVGIYFGLNYAAGDLEACRSMLADKHTVTGLSDAGAHVNFVCDMSIPTFNLTHWVRDRGRGERLPIELVVAKCTATPAKIFGLGDRGSLEVGKRADINVIDLEHLKVEAPQLRRDLPAGGSRFVQPSTGYLATLVAGAQTRERDEDTGERPGRLARRSDRIVDTRLWDRAAV